MGYQQTVETNDGAQDYAGMCLRFAQKVFNTKPYGYDSAWAAWEATMVKHYDRNFPQDVVCPVFFSHMGSYGDPLVYKNWGHVVCHFPGRGFLSSPGNGYGQQWFGSIEEIESYFRCTHVGWAEDINDLTVMVGNADPAPAPTPTPSQTTHTVIVDDNLWGIAERFYGVANWDNVMGIANANGIENPALIHPGDVLVIP